MITPTFFIMNPVYKIDQYYLFIFQHKTNTKTKPLEENITYSHDMSFDTCHSRDLSIQF